MRRAVTSPALATALILGCVSAQDLGSVRPAATPDASVSTRCTRSDETRECYSGALATLGVGRCHGGSQRCDPLTGRFAATCEGEETPAGIEVCANALDDDCDGAVDEDCDAPRLVAVAVGDRASCALAREREGARVLCWGDASSGLFGDAREGRTRPVRIESPPDVSALAMGAAHLCMLSRAEVWCLGRNRTGALGDDTLTDRTHPVLVEGVTNVTALAAGRFHTCALRADGSVWCWGADDLAQTGATSAPTVPCERGRCHTRAHRVDGLERATALTAGFDHTCATRSDGSALCWGSSAAFRVMPTGATVAVATPAEVFAAARAERVVAGGESTCARSTNAGRTTIECFGRLRALTTPFGDTITLLAGGARWHAIDANSSYTRTNEMWWSDPATPAPEVVPLRLTPSVALGVTVRQMAVGISHACLVAGDHAVRCWGVQNAYGQLGIGSAAIVMEPSMDVRW